MGLEDRNSVGAQVQNQSIMLSAGLIVHLITFQLPKYQVIFMLRPLPFSEGPFCSKESHYISPLTKKKIPLRVFATAEHAHQTQLLLDTTAKILPVYEKVTLNLFQYYSLDNSPNMNSFPFYSRYSIFLILFLKLSRSA
ncbi:hypothetical protein VP01_122g1 [Puccinia sorghi]|uniref:Uncharacterized protein n=1 Tax=Puccinia sorghi TaxID=27349 RepID=A0A0L6VPS1_9BASI|nr:hypothetical protein VP01_122g1 [Puccinia sorghi]